MTTAPAAVAPHPLLLSGTARHLTPPQLVEAMLDFADELERKVPNAAAREHIDRIRLELADLDTLLPHIRNAGVAA